jgi:hypothetical protein
MRDSDNDFVEKFSGTLNHIQVTVRHRVKAAWIDRASHLRKLAEEF